ncbi:PTS sugar transporter subunit IIA, partial [Streptococcus pyogenes]
ASYQDYLIRMVDLLEEEDLVDSGFRERTLEREKQESTIFGNGIGFPHTINQVGNKTILMLGVLDETHCEKGEVVDLIF